MTDLFGTVMNAHRRLGLENSVPYQHFYRGMHFETITPKHKELIEEAWQRWQYLYLRPEVPPSDNFTITLDNRDVCPTWLEDKELV
jgi:hypothetical protein